MFNGVCYLNIGTKHSDNLVVSLLSLKDHWAGPVCIWAGDEQASTLAHYCKDDGRLGDIQVVKFDFDAISSGHPKYKTSFVKTVCLRTLSPFDTTVFIDADTLVVGNFMEVFPCYDNGEVRLTKQCDWLSNGRILKKRLTSWADVEPALVRLSLSRPYPAINTGVLGFSRKTDAFMDHWADLAGKKTEANCNEKSCQLLYPHYPHVLLDVKYNCSPKNDWRWHGVDGTVGGEKILGPQDGTADPRIWHFYGRRSVGKPTGRYIWSPYYERAVAGNYARIREWTPQDSRLRRWLNNKT